jgi:hypothetical protein
MAQLSKDVIRATAVAQNGIAAKAVATVSRLLPSLDGLDRQTAGGAIRVVAGGVIDKFGDLALITASDYYKKLRASGTPEATAVALTRRQNDPVFLAWAAEVDKSKAERTSKAVGRSMAKFSAGFTFEAETDLGATVGREVTNIFRETMANAASQDSAVVGYQRVASASACAFCATVALNQYTSFEDDDGYHDHCGCTTVPIFKGLDAYRPDYYDNFQSEYEEAFASVNSSSAEDILSAMRTISGRS